MKNYLGRLGILRKAAQPDIETAIQAVMKETTDIQSIADADTVLSNKVTRTYYERTHLQYEAISAALDCLNSPIATNTHRWTDRLVEFDTELDEPLV